MKNTSLLLLLPLLFTGCIGVNVHRQPNNPPPPPPNTVVVPLTTPDSATIAEIDAAAGLNFDDAKLQAFTAIAQRPALSAAVQVHLVNTAYRRLNFDDAKVTLIKAVIANPAFGDAAKQSIVTQLGRLNFDDRKQQVLAALNARAAMPPAEATAAH